MIYILAALAMFGLDQAVKYWASTYLLQHGSIPIIKGIFHLTYVQNDGAAFSMLQGMRWGFVVITVFAFGLLIYMLKSGMLKGKLGHWSVTFIIGGALGNFFDRLRMGYVVDMFDLRIINFAVFNVADICITIGALIFIYLIYLDFQAERRAVKGE